MREVYIDSGITQNRAGLFDNGKLVDLFIENVDDINISGNIYKGRVENVVYGLNAAFINIGSDKNAMLHFESRDELEKIKRGAELLVQVIREPSKDKGARVTSEVCLTGKYSVLVPNGSGINISRKIESEHKKKQILDEMNSILENGFGLIMRTESADSEIEEIKNEYYLLKNLWDDIQKHSDYIKAPSLVYDFRNLYSYLMREFIKGDVESIYVNRESDIDFLRKLSSLYNINAAILYDKNNFLSFEKIEREIKSLLERRKELPSGGFIFVEKTEAMIVFDVNTGSFIDARNKGETILKTNIEAGREIAHIIKLCNFSGIIIIDFIDMISENDKNSLMENLNNEFKNDRMPVKLFGFTRLGLMEISRPRKGKNIYEVLYRDYLSRSLSYSYLLKIAENECIRYSLSRKVNKISLSIHPEILSEIEEYLNYFKEEMLHIHSISINYIYTDKASCISIIP